MAEILISRLKNILEKREKQFNNISNQMQISSPITFEQKLITNFLSPLYWSISEIHNIFQVIITINEFKFKELSNKDVAQVEIATKISELLKHINEDFEKYRPILESGLRQLEKLHEER